jgi:hypothetical protein
MDGVEIMAIIQIPLRNDLDAYDFSIDLEGLTYNFEVEFNTRTGLWSMSIFDSDLNLLIAGVPMVVNSDLTSRFNRRSLPPGFLMLYDTSGKNVECTKSDFGSRCVLLYQEAA